MKLTAKDLRDSLRGVPDDAMVVFQGNVRNEEDGREGDEPGYTTCLGYVYSGWHREAQNEFVIDGAITESEG